MLKRVYSWKIVYLDYQSEVSILTPMGYGSTMLPLCHSNMDEVNIANALTQLV